MTEVSLRPLEIGDAEALFDIIDRNRPELSKFWWEKQTQQVADSEKFIQSVNDSEAADESLTRGICLSEGLIGVAALHTFDWRNRRSLLGYWLDKRQAGHGYGTAATRQIIRLAFEEKGLDEVRIATRVSNTGSRAIAEKLGFTLLQVADEPLWQDDSLGKIPTAIYALRSDEVTF